MLSGAGLQAQARSFTDTKVGAEEHFLEAALVLFNLLLFPPSWIFLSGLQAGVIGKSWL